MRYLTAGESHGPALTGIIEGLPSGLLLDEGFISAQLARRQGGYGRGGRMALEKDRVRFLAGVRFGRTLGSPVTLLIENKDWVNWQDIMSPSPLPEQAGDAENDQSRLNKEGESRAVTSPRPGHADLAGGLKYGHRDLRNVLERASARETAMRVAIGAVAGLLLRHFQIDLAAFVLSVGDVEAEVPERDFPLAELRGAVAESELYCPDLSATREMIQAILQTREEGDTLGGIFEVRVDGLPPGLGSHVQADRRLDGRIAAALMSIPGIKGVEVGLGFEAARRKGSRVHDAILTDEKAGFVRETNRAGGLEGGITNGEQLVVRAAMKPIPTLLNALPSVDLRTMEPVKAAVERSDVCAVPAASVVGEAVVAWELARAFCEKFGGDSMTELEQSFQHYQEIMKNLYVEKE